MPPNPRPASIPLPHGSVDYTDMFTPDAPWKKAAAHIDAFMIPSWYVRLYADDVELTGLLEDLERRGIPLALAMEPLEHPDPSECAQTESFEGSIDLAQAQRIKDLGGTVALVGLDEPYAFAHKLDGPDACQRPVAAVAEETAAFVKKVRALFPHVVVGSMEPIWSKPRIVAEDMRIWLEAYQKAAGERFAFLDLDVPWREWDIADLGPVLLQTEKVADAHGVPFGVIYNGQPDAPTDREWTRQAAEAFWEFEQDLGGTPEQVPIMSWNDRPYHLLPETTFGSFTSLINQYFGDRTALTVSARGAPGGRMELSGRLTTTGGDAVPGAPVSLSVTGEAATEQTLVATGTVPAKARSALVAVRVNTENAGPGRADDLVHAVSVRTGGRNLVPNADFSAGMSSWGSYGDVPAVVVGTPSGSAMRLQAPRSKSIVVDGSTSRSSRASGSGSPPPPRWPPARPARPSSP